MAAMQVDGVEGPAEPGPEEPAPGAPRRNPHLSFEILQSIKTAQTQHGLRHNDYGRYKCGKWQAVVRLRRTVLRLGLAKCVIADCTGSTAPRSFAVYTAGITSRMAAESTFAGGSSPQLYMMQGVHPEAARTTRAACRLPVYMPRRRRKPDITLH